ncbi:MULTISPECIES: hypothetical protein [unclassified Nostoc]|nr:hypothetical protein [Nostoc sp. JL31]
MINNLFIGFMNPAIAYPPCNAMSGDKPLLYERLRQRFYANI